MSEDEPSVTKTTTQKGKAPRSRKRKLSSGQQREMQKKLRAMKKKIREQSETTRIVLGILTARPHFLMDDQPFSTLYQPFMQCIEALKKANLISPPSLSEEPEVCDPQKLDTTPNFFNRVCSGKPSYPVSGNVLIIGHEVKTQMKSRYVAMGNYQKQIRISISDGDMDTVMLGVVASELLGQQSLFVPGTVIRITRFSRMSYNIKTFSGEPQYSIGLLIHEAEFVQHAGPDVVLNHKGVGYLIPDLAVFVESCSTSTSSTSTSTTTATDSTLDTSSSSTVSTSSTTLTSSTRPAGPDKTLPTSSTSPNTTISSPSTTTATSSDTISTCTPTTSTVNPDTAISTAATSTASPTPELEAIAEFAWNEFFNDINASTQYQAVPDLKSLATCVEVNLKQVDRLREFTTLPIVAGVIKSWYDPSFHCNPDDAASMRQSVRDFITNAPEFFAGAGQLPIESDPLPPFVPISHWSPQALPECDGTCKVNGLWSPICVLKGIAVPELEEIKPFCWFATMPVRDMSKNHKRNMLYWWFAVNVFAFTGPKSRQALPKCVVKYVRNLFPESEDRLYKGFEVFRAKSDDTTTANP